MPYSYNGAAINFPPVGEYISFSSVNAEGAIVPGTQTIVLGTSVNNLPSFPTNAQGAFPQLSANDYLPIVNVHTVLGVETSFGYKVTLSQVASFLGIKIDEDSPGEAGSSSDTSFNNGILLNEDKYIKWDYAIGETTYEYGITFHQTDGWKFKGLTSGFATQALGLTKSGVLKLTGIAVEPAIVAGGLYYDNTNLYFGY